MSGPTRLRTCLCAFVVAATACGPATGPSAPSTTAEPQSAGSSSVAGGGASSSPGAIANAPTTPGPFGRHDTPPGSVAEFLGFGTGGGEFCEDRIEEVRPSVELVVFPEPVLVCAYDFMPDRAIDATLGGPGGWTWQGRARTDEAGWAEWRLDDLPSHLAGEYAVEASQGEVRSDSVTVVEFEYLAAAFRPESLGIGQTGRLIIGGGPPSTSVPAYLYRQDNDRQGHSFVADLGTIPLDAGGEGVMEITPRPGDPPGGYMIDVIWPPGSSGGGGPEFSIEGEVGDDVGYIYDGIRPGLGGCSRREADLPPGAIAAVECQPDSGLVASVGFYLFGSEADMLAAYFDRLAGNGIERDSGDCEAGQSGDRVWGESEGDRIGCFLNDQGFANLRWTVASGPIYIGVLGENDDIGALMDWSSAFPVGTSLWVRP